MRAKARDYEVSVPWRVFGLYQSAAGLEGLGHCAGLGPDFWGWGISSRRGRRVDFLVFLVTWMDLLTYLLLRLA